MPAVVIGAEKGQPDVTLARHTGVVPPLLPAQVQDPLLETDEAAPEAHNRVVGRLPKYSPFAVPHTPFTAAGVAEPTIHWAWAGATGSAAKSATKAKPVNDGFFKVTPFRCAYHSKGVTPFGWPENYLTIVIPPADGVEPPDNAVQTLKPGLLVVSPGYAELGAKLMRARIEGR